MTQHEQHMEVYATAILGTLKVFAQAFLVAASHRDWIDGISIQHFEYCLDSVCEEAEKITEQRNKSITEQENAK